MFGKRILLSILILRGMWQDANCKFFEPANGTKFYAVLFFICFYFSFSVHVQAQVSVEFPYSGLVFQRNTSNNGEILVSGYSQLKADTIQARLLPFAPNTGQATSWVDCRTYSVGILQNFSTLIKATAGWYNLQVRVVKNAVSVAETTVLKIGIGEVFLIAGQSNAQGQTLKGALSTADPYERVGAFSGYDEKMETPSFKAEPLNNYISIYPVGVTSWCWAELGDKIAKRLNIPVFFLNAAWGGTGSEDWVKSLDSTATFEVGRGHIPYGYLHRSIQFYKNVLGLRAVLWHQGESDAYRNHFDNLDKRIDYFGNLQKIITPSRKQAGGELAWVISRTSLIYGITDSLVIRDQQRLAAEMPNVFAGPYTDTLTNARFDGVHFTNEFDKRGLSKLANLWDQALDSTFFKMAVPMLPTLKSTFLLENGQQTLPSGFQKAKMAGERKSYAFLTDETGNYYISSLIPCGKRYKQFREYDQQDSFNEIISSQQLKKQVILNDKIKSNNNVIRSSRAILLNPGFVADSTTTFTAEIDGCY